MICFGAVVGGDLGQLRKRDSFAGGRQQAHVFDGLARIAVLLLIAQRYVVARLALLHLRHCIGADRGLHRVLNIRDVDAPARGGFAVHCEVEIRLADDAEDAQVRDALDRRHLRSESFRPLLSSVRRSSP